MNELKQRAFEVVYGLHNGDKISRMDEATICAGLDDIESLHKRDTEPEKLWAQLADILMDPNTEDIETRFLDWESGTPREDIWHWFDERHSKGVAYLLYGDAANYVSETRRMYSLSRQCFDCESTDCAYNYNGSCRFALIAEDQPKVTQEDRCCVYLRRV